jgi:hypothetical protein
MDLLIELSADGPGLPAANDPNRYAHLRPGSEPLQVSTLASDLAVVQEHRGHGLE